MQGATRLRGYQRARGVLHALVVLSVLGLALLGSCLRPRRGGYSSRRRQVRQAGGARSGGAFSGGGGLGVLCVGALLLFANGEADAMTIRSSVEPCAWQYRTTPHVSLGRSYLCFLMSYSVAVLLESIVNCWLQLFVIFPGVGHMIRALKIV